MKFRPTLTCLAVGIASLEGRYAQRIGLPVRRSAGVLGRPGVTVSSRR